LLSRLALIKGVGNDTRPPVSGGIEGGKSPTTACADFEGSAALVAITVTFWAALTDAGAVYNPA
jgi:hypothetical protein